MPRMDDKTFNAQVARTKKAVTRWVTPCGLNMWADVEFQYHRDTIMMVDASDHTVDESERRVAGRTIVDWRYKHATIHFNMAVIQNLSDHEIDRLVRHEICHLLVNEMREWEHLVSGAKNQSGSRDRS